MKKLIVTADDFGLTERINEAIVLAYRNGIVTSASLMVNAPAVDSAVDLALNNPGLDIGLHLYITDDPFKFVSAFLRGKVRSADVEREIRAQIEKALATGLQITHVDGHKHVHVIPPILKIVRRVAPLYGIKAIRSTMERTPQITSLLQGNPKSRVAILKQWVFGKTASAAWRWSWPPKAEAAMMTPDDFYGIAYTGFLDLRALASIAGDLRPGVHELMCHPGYVDDQLCRTPTRLRVQRERELALVTSRAALDLIQRAGIELVSYRDLIHSCRDNIVGVVRDRPEGGVE